MTKAEQLRRRADEVATEAASIRWTAPAASRHLDHIANDLRHLADSLPPERATS